MWISDYLMRRSWRCCSGFPHNWQGLLAALYFFLSLRQQVTDHFRSSHRCFLVPSWIPSPTPAGICTPTSFLNSRLGLLIPADALIAFRQRLDKVIGTALDPLPSIRPSRMPCRVSLPIFFPSLGSPSNPDAIFSALFFLTSCLVDFFAAVSPIF